MSLSSLNLIGKTVLELESGTKMWTDRQMDRQMDKKHTNEHTEFHQFQQEPSYDGDLSPWQV